MKTITEKELNKLLKESEIKVIKEKSDMASLKESDIDPSIDTNFSIGRLTCDIITKLCKKYGFELRNFSEKNYFYGNIQICYPNTNEINTAINYDLDDDDLWFFTPPNASSGDMKLNYYIKKGLKESYELGIKALNLAEEIKSYMNI